MKKKEVVRGYKAFDTDLKCREFQYELGKDYFTKSKVVTCKNGFHFCRDLKDVYEYYPFGSVIAEVEAFGDVIDEGNKSVTNGIRLVRILDAEKEAKVNTGRGNTGYGNSGNWNSADCNSGNFNSGHRNSGDRNSGHWNSADCNSGDRNSGYKNSGYKNSGSGNSGNYNSGHGNGGDKNSGSENSGHWNSGNHNSGNWNSGDFNSGDFNSDTPKEIRVFNKMCLKEIWDAAEKPPCLYFYLNDWVGFEDMTEDEKREHPTARTMGGYLKTRSYKEAFAESLKKAGREEIEAIKRLPNFDADIFEEISGVRI